MSEAAGDESGDIAVGTIVAKNFLPAARVLSRSIRARHPQVPVFVLLTDEVDGCFDPAHEPFTLLTLDSLGLPDRRRLCFRYMLHELAASAKPWLLSHLLDLGFRGAVFLDPDVLVVGDLTPLLLAARRHDLVLTPHLLRPTSGDDRAARELAILSAGVFNGGCLGTCGSPPARRFFAWAQERLLHHCRRDVANGLYHDQRWLDLAPGLLDDVCILRDPGCNVAYWNLHERALQAGPDAVLADGQPCRFIHFSGYSPEQPQRVTRHVPALRLADIGDAAPLFESYGRLLEEAGFAQAARWPYAYGAFDNGVPIPAIARQLHAELGPSADRFGDPFRTHAPASFFRWLQQPVDGGPASRPISRLWDAVYRQRADVQRAFPDPRGKDRREFLQWARRTGAGEHGVPEDFLHAAAGIVAAAR